jgi:hypothetical protein
LGRRPHRGFPFVPLLSASAPRITTAQIKTRSFQFVSKPKISSSSRPAPRAEARSPQRVFPGRSPAEPRAISQAPHASRLFFLTFNNRSPARGHLSAPERQAQNPTRGSGQP